MKRLLILIALLSIPALASAQATIEWRTYCDGVGVERVRCSLTVDLGNVYFDEETAASLQIFYSEQCVDEGVVIAGGIDRTPEPLGNGIYQYMWDGFLRSAFPFESPAYLVQISFLAEGTRFLQHVYCTEPVAIIDGIECSPLPVTPATWGAVKALYR